MSQTLGYLRPRTATEAPPAILSAGPVVHAHVQDPSLSPRRHRELSLSPRLVGGGAGASPASGSTAGPVSSPTSAAAAVAAAAAAAGSPGGAGAALPPQTYRAGPAPGAASPRRKLAVPAGCHSPTGNNWVDTAGWCVTAPVAQPSPPQTVQTCHVAGPQVLTAAAAAGASPTSCATVLTARRQYVPSVQLGS